ncbi:MAG: protein kinase [Kiritimatiellae bacterium]|nr:protein kinase [Kiritimatiellia bacterium]
MPPNPEQSGGAGRPLPADGMACPNAADSLESLCAAHAPVADGGRFAAGTVFGDWRVTAFIGRGGNGEVYCAEHVTLGTSAAVKVLVREEDRAKERFEREAKLLAQMKSKAFPRFFAYGEANPPTQSCGAINRTAYIAMELLEPGELPTGDCAVAKFMLKVCEAAGELHALGYVHRDIKPGNILWRLVGSRVPRDRGRAGRASLPVPVLADLGLVKETKPTNSQLTNSQLTIGGVGTPGYGAPEQMERGEATEASDIHALGVLADRCFGGRPPRAWKRIIERATSSIPSYRYQSVVALARAIRRRHWIWYAIGLMVSLLVVVAMPYVEPRHADIGAEQLTVKREGVQKTDERSAKKQRKTDEHVKPEREYPGQGMLDEGDEKWQALMERVKYDEERRRKREQLLMQERDRAEKMSKKVKQHVEESVRRTQEDNKSVGDSTNMPIVSVRRLEGKKVMLAEPIILEGGREYQVYGPGTLDADLFCPTTAILRLKDCVLLNRTKRLYPENGIQYRLDNGVYLNFINVRSKPWSLHVRDFTGMYDGAYNQVRFGGPETVQELMEQMSEEQAKDLRNTTL